MTEGLKLLIHGLPIVFLVLAAIFMGTKVLHWFLPNEAKPGEILATQSAPQKDAISALTKEEQQAIQIAVYHATKGQGVPGKIIDIRKSQEGS
ncbi:hypothetical protein JXJ21_14520 [candidate division KSB1 bacterium]|nr:hypothetical protein [candidate division KSB1 bacterium]